MEDARHPSGRFLKVARKVERSRLGEQTMASVYERLVPMVGTSIPSAGGGSEAAPWPEEARGRPARAWGA